MKFEHKTEFNCDGTITILEIPHNLDKIPSGIETKIIGTRNKCFIDFNQTRITVVFSTPPVGKITVKWNVMK